MKLLKNERVVYRSGLGFLYSARVLTRHKDGSFTIRLSFPLDENGKEMPGCYQGDHLRVGPQNLVEG